MAAAFYQTHTTTGAKTPWNGDWQLDHFTVTIAAIIVSGAATYSVEYTLDDLNDTSVTPRWLTFDEAPVGTTATKVIQLNNPVLWVRINIAVITGTVEFKIIQGMRQR